MSSDRDRDAHGIVEGLIHLADYMTEEGGARYTAELINAAVAIIQEQEAKLNASVGESQYKQAWDWVFGHSGHLEHLLKGGSPVAPDVLLGVAEALMRKENRHG